MTSKRIQSMVFSCLLPVFIIFAAISPAGGGEQYSTGHDFTAIDAYVEAEMKKGCIPGLALGIVQGDSIAYLRGFGVSDTSGQHVTPQTPFVIASLSKSFTALAVMQLAERGMIDLDEPLQRYIPWFQVSDPDGSASVTVRHLLNHESGVSSNEDRLLLVAESDMTLEKRVRQMKDIELAHPPGTAFQYSNWNYVATGLLVEIVSGQSYEEYISQNIFEPLEMQNSFASEAKARENGMATGYRWWFGFPFPADLPYPHDVVPAGYIISSAEDMTHFLIANINHGRYEEISILPPEGLAEMHRPPARQLEAPYYGMGWGVVRTNGQTRLMHDGFTPNFFASMVIAPEEELGVIVLTNASNLYAPKMAGRVAENVMEMFAGREPAETGWGFRMFYLIVNIVASALTALLVLSFVKLRKWRGHLLKVRPSRLPSILRRIVLPIMGDFVLPFVLLYFIPSGAGFPFWTAMRLFQPDVAYWALGIAVVMLISGTIRIGLAFSVLKTAAE